MKKINSKTIALSTTLKRLSLSTGLSVNHLRVLVALERVVARFEIHPILRQHLIFKGGFALLKKIEAARYTRDVDALAKDIMKSEIPRYVNEALSFDLGDGFWFGDVLESELMVDRSYGGLRFDCAFFVGTPLPSTIKIKKLSRFHIDIGFGDSLPELKRQQMPTWLPTGEPISWLVYPLEYMLAEKLETLCQRGSANSRAKDVFDLLELFARCTEINSLLMAIKSTFKTRGTALPASFFDFASDLTPLTLRSAWGSILASDKLSFEDAWSALLAYLQTLDSNLVRA